MRDCEIATQTLSGAEKRRVFFHRKALFGVQTAKTNTVLTIKDHEGDRVVVVLDSKGRQALREIIGDAEAPVRGSLLLIVGAAVICLYCSDLLAGTGHPIAVAAMNFLALLTSMTAGRIVTLLARD